jgi:hypothetical protein
MAPVRAGTPNHVHLTPGLRQRRAVGGRGGRGGGRRLRIPGLATGGRAAAAIGKKTLGTRSCARRWMRVLDHDTPPAMCGPIP